MSSPVTYRGNGVQTRFEVPGSITKVVQVNGVVVTPASSDFQSVTLSSAPGVGVPVSIAYAGVVSPNPSNGTGSGTTLRDASTSIVLDAQADYAPLAIAGATTIAVSGATRAGAAVMTVVANGSNVPAITGADMWDTSADFLNLANIPNRLDVWFDGYAARYSWSQQRTPSAVAVSSVPVIGTAPVVGSATVGVALTWTAAAAITGYPTPTVTYDVLIGGSVVSANATSGSYTPVSAGGSLVVRATATNASGSTSSSSGAVTIAASATVPGAPTSVSATAGDASAAVAFSPPASNGGSAITGYTVTASPGGATATGPSTPLTVSGLTNGTAYTFTVQATNAVGTGSASSASSAVTPAASTEAALTLTTLNQLTASGANYVGDVGVTGFQAYGTPAGVLGSGVDGWVSLNLGASTGGIAAVVGFSATPSPTHATTLVAFMQISTSGIFRNQNTVAASSPTLIETLGTAASTLRYRLGRLGAVWTIQKSNDTGATWTTIYTFIGVSSTALLYPVIFTNASSTFYAPKALGVV